MAYTPDTLVLLAEASGPVGYKRWIYDTVDAVGSIDATGYFSNGEVVGMEVGDEIIARIWTTAVPVTTAAKNAAPPADMAKFVVIARSAAGACSTATETAIVVASP